MLMQQLQEVKAIAARPKEDDLEAFAEKLQKMQAVSQMMGGSSGNFLESLIGNMDTIGQGAAQIIQAAKGGKPDAPDASGAPQPPPTLTGAPQRPSLPPAQTQTPATAQTNEEPEPPKGVLEAHAALVKAAGEKNEKAVADSFVVLVRELATASTEPFPSLARRLLTAFSQAEDAGELYTLSKNLFIVAGQEPVRPLCKYIAGVLERWYSALHQSFFNEPKSLPQDGDGAAVVQASQAVQAAALPAGVVADDQDDGEEGGDDGEDDGETVEGAA
jgi:hypothetical protein